MGDEGGTGFNSSRGFAINGQRQESSGFQVDGVENTDMGNGVGLLTSPGMETIGEFKMKTSRLFSRIWKRWRSKPVGRHTQWHKRFSRGGL